MSVYLQYYDQPTSEPSDAQWIISFLLIAAFLIYILIKKRREAIAVEEAKLVQENGLLERYKSILLQLASVAPDVRVLKTTVDAAELVGTVNGCKTYILLQHSALFKAIVTVTLAVVTPGGTRKRVLTYDEPVNPLDIWQDVKVEVEKLIDNVYGR